MTSLEPISICAILPSGEILDDVSPGMSCQESVSNSIPEEMKKKSTKVVAFILRLKLAPILMGEEATYGPIRGEAGAVGGVSEIGRKNPSDLAMPVRERIA
jgi:hypothetical protein